MGIVEDKIKDDLLQSVYADCIGVYEFIDARFSLDEEQRDVVIKKINDLNSDLVTILKEVKLS